MPNPQPKQTSSVRDLIVSAAANVENLGRTTASAAMRLATAHDRLLPAAAIDAHERITLLEAELVNLRGLISQLSGG